MSISMVLGRVVLPASAVVLAIALAWRWAPGLAAVRTGAPPEKPGADARAEGAASGSGGRTDRVTAEGRVVAHPGAEVTVGTEVLGTIVTMPVRENMTVRKGALLAQFRDDEVRASLREAHARLTEAEVGLRLEQARSGLDRILPGLASQPPSPRAVHENLTMATARRDAARADVDRLEAEVARYRILAPIEGVIVARHADPGETLSPAAPLVTIADLSRLRVEAEVDEFDIPRVTPRARATITAEGYDGRRWRGEVEEIAAAVVARRTRPADPGRPADTRVLLVAVAFREPTPLKLGQRVEVEIERP